MRASILTVSLLCSASLSAQTITFAGTLNGTPTPLDSIHVENLTASGDSMLYAPDTVLVLGFSTGVRSFDIGADMFSMPNPFRGSAEIVVNSTGGEMLITVHDAMGRGTASMRLEANPGHHRFRYINSTPGLHILSVQQDGQLRTLRMVALEGTDAHGSTLSYLGNSGLAKSNRSLFSWQPGDELRYTGYGTSNGNVLSAVIEEVPTVSATRTFLFVAASACVGTSTVTDIDGNVYPVVSIGNQCWMAANLRTSRYSDGSIIPKVTNGFAWSNLTTGAWRDYENNASYDATYGKLYNWYAAANANVCPQGWQIPTDEEWTQLSDYLGGENVAGGKMKSLSPLWLAPNTDATNESGFSGLPGGTSDFSDLGYTGNFWSATEFSANSAWNRFMYYEDGVLYRLDGGKQLGFSLRCLRNCQAENCEEDCNGDLGGAALPGTACNDGDSATINDVYGNDCVCAGQPGCSTTVTDIDGNVYPVVSIGGQCWMASDLRTAHYRDGSTIPNVTGDNEWSILSTAAWSNFNNDPANDATYGKLYNWNAAANPNICPLGWHVPTDDEWVTMEMALGMPMIDWYAEGYRGTAQNVGGKMKSISSLWNAPNNGATNESGFSGLPGGFRGANGLFTSSGLGYGGWWWTASEVNTDNVWTRNLLYPAGAVSRGPFGKQYGLCLRCLRD